MNHVAIGRALTASFSRAGIFTKYEYTRVSPTLIRCSCATIECKEEGVDSGFFAKRFMENKEDTTNIHYNLYPNYREALKLAMLMGGVKRKVMKCEVDELINEIYKGEKNLPWKETIVNSMQKSSTDSKEMAEIYDILKELDTDKRKTESLYNNSPTTSERKIAFREKVLVIFKVIF